MTPRMTPAFVYFCSGPDNWSVLLLPSIIYYTLKITKNQVDRAGFRHYNVKGKITARAAILVSVF